MLDINKGGSSSPANRVPIADEEGVTVAPDVVTEVLGQLDLGPVLASLDKDLKPKWTGPPFFRSNEATAWGCLWKCWVCCSCWWCKNSDMWPWGSSLETVPTSSSVRISTPVDLLLLLNGGLVLFALLNKGLAFIRSKKSLQRKYEIMVSNLATLKLEQINKYVPSLVSIHSWSFGTVYRGKCKGLRSGMRWPMPRRSVSQFAPITGRRGRGAIGHEKVRTWWGTFLEAGHDWKTKKRTLWS